MRIDLNKYYMNEGHKRILLEYFDSNSGMLGCALGSIQRYNIISDLEDADFLKHYATKGGYIYHEITETGKAKATLLKIAIELKQAI